MFPGAGTVIGAGVGFLLGLFGIGNHDNPSVMADKYDTARYTQYIGELTGFAQTAYGPPYDAASDPVEQALGGVPMLDYIQNWIQQNQNSSDPVKKKLAMQLLPIWGTAHQGLHYTHGVGYDGVIGGSESGNYISIYQDAMNAIQQITTLMGDTAQPNQLVALNQYGTSGGGFTYSWNIPGYDAPSTPPGSSGGTTPGSPGGTGISPINPGHPRGGGPSPGGPGNGSRTNTSSRSNYGYTIPNISIGLPDINVSHTVMSVLDGRQIARSTQAYTLRNTAQGYQKISI